MTIITIPATHKYDGGGVYGLTKKSMHEINMYGSGVIVGGGNLYENGEIDVTSMRSRSKPLMILNVSVGKMSINGLLTRRTDTISDAKPKALSVVRTSTS